MSYSLTLILDIENDAWNRWDACNKISHGVNWADRIDKETAGNITGKTQEEANLFLIPYLKNLYKEREQDLNNILKFGQKRIDAAIDAACKKMEEVTGKKLYRNTFVGYLTTFPRGPYNYQKGHLWICCKGSIKNYMGTFLHELLHFQFIHYRKNNLPVSKLNNNQFEFLKEALTFILNYEFEEFLGKEDGGYPSHQKFRKELVKHWEKHGDFEKLVEFGVERVQELDVVEASVVK